MDIVFLLGAATCFHETNIMAGTCCLSGLGGRMRQIQGEEQFLIHSVNQVVRALNSDLLTRALTVYMTSIMRSLIVQKCLFCFFKKYFILGMCIFESVWGKVHNSPGTHGGQKQHGWSYKVLGTEPSPRQKLSIFLRTETSLQPPNLILSRIFYMCMAH